MIFDNIVIFEVCDGKDFDVIWDFFCVYVDWFVIDLVY